MTQNCNELGEGLSIILAYVDGGPRSRICPRLSKSLGPHRHERKFVDACVRKVTFKHLPQPLSSHMESFRTIGQLLKIPPFARPKIA